MIHKGLSEEEVLESRKKYGMNIIDEAAPVTFWDKFKEGLGDSIIKLLIVCGIIMGVVNILTDGSLSDIVSIFIAVVLVTTISANTAIGADKAFRKLTKGIKKDVAKVYRNGKIVEVIIDDLVVGDMIILQNGDKVLADGILIEGSLIVNNASLNGESDDCEKFAVEKDFLYKDIHVTGETIVDKHSLFKDAVVIDGEAVMEVKKVGMNTMMGIASKDMLQEKIKSPLEIKLSVLAGQISKFGYIGSVVIAVALMIHKITVAGGMDAYFNMGGLYILMDCIAAVMLALTIIIMAVPEGLPLMIAMVLMQNTSKLLDRNVLVRKAIGIETAGSLNILFSDKTGTITKGKLEVVEFFGGDLLDSYKGDTKVKELIRYAIGKNTAAMFDASGKVIGGNATDKTLLTFLTQNEFEKISSKEVIKSQGFNSTNKYSSSQIENRTYYKGAPERLVENATRIVDVNGNIVNIDKAKINEKIDLLAKKAMRVLAFAYSDKPLEKDVLPEDLIIIGFTAIRDDVRVEAKTAIKAVQDAGIQVVMITGDRKETAIAIARDAGLLTTEGNYDINGLGELVLTSEDLNQLSDDEVKEIIPRLRVVARALPSDKSRMVKLSQELNLVCGMTGDGVNDAPALESADVGFAMGSGTDVAKNASSIVILDDNFKSIESTILYGRTIYNNILKFIKFQLTINVAAVAVNAIAPFVGIEEPLRIVHILLINLVMDGLGALALGAEPALDSYMKEKPKSRTQSIVSKKMLSQVIFAGLWLTGLSFIFFKLPAIQEMFGSTSLELSIEHRTAYFTLFVLTAVFNGFNVRSESVNVLENIGQNKGFIKVMGIIVIVQVALTFVGGDLFSCAPFSLEGWILVTVMAVSIIPADMIRKLIVSSK